MLTSGTPPTAPYHTGSTASPLRTHDSQTSRSGGHVTSSFLRRSKRRTSSSTRVRSPTRSVCTSRTNLPFPVRCRSFPSSMKATCSFCLFPQTTKPMPCARTPTKKLFPSRMTSCSILRCTTGTSRAGRRTSFSRHGRPTSKLSSLAILRASRNRTCCGSTTFVRGGI